MQEYSSPTAFQVPPTAALPDAVTEHATSAPDRVALSRNVGGRWEPVTSRQFAEQVSALARGLGPQPPTHHVHEPFELAHARCSRSRLTAAAMGRRQWVIDIAST